MPSPSVMQYMDHAPRNTPPMILSRKETSTYRSGSSTDSRSGNGSSIGTNPVGGGSPPRPHMPHSHHLHSRSRPRSHSRDDAPSIHHHHERAHSSFSAHSVPHIQQSSVHRMPLHQDLSGKTSSFSQTMRPNTDNHMDTVAQPGPEPWAIGFTDGIAALKKLARQKHERERDIQRARTHSSSSSSNNSPIMSHSHPRFPVGNADMAGGTTLAHRLSDSPPVAIGTGTTVRSSSPPEHISSIGTVDDVGGFNGAHADGKASEVDIDDAIATVQAGQSLYQGHIFTVPSSSVEVILAASCEAMGFDIAEMWLRTGTKTHQLINSHLRPTALDDSARDDLVDVYYGEKSNERTHRLSPALCKRAKDAKDVVWVTSHTPHGAEALRCSISNVRTAVAVPVCHAASNTNMTIIYFSIHRVLMRPAAVEFLVHLSLSAAVASVNMLAEDGLVDCENAGQAIGECSSDRVKSQPNEPSPSRVLYTEPRLDIQWSQLKNVEYLTDGGCSWLHSAVLNSKPVVIKTLKPECQDVAISINEIENELVIHSKLQHPNIVNLIGAGSTSKGVRFLVLERLDGGTLTQMLGYDTRIRDRRRRFWQKNSFSYIAALRCARAIASAMRYLHEEALPGGIILHRDLKPDNIGFTLNGTVKLIDFGLSRMLENADAANLNEVYSMSGETGSLRYMAPEVAEGLPYNQLADVYSFGMILWELNAGKKPFEGLTRETFYERVVHGGERPLPNEKWPSDFQELLQDCWSEDVKQRPSFSVVLERLDSLIRTEKNGTSKKSLRKKKSWF